jgi:hypothetical protein
MGQPPHAASLTFSSRACAINLWFVWPAGALTRPFSQRSVENNYASNSHHTITNRMPIQALIAQNGLKISEAYHRNAAAADIRSRLS